ncbi:MAG: F0F1 ATP synthase subunit B [Armatimonadetes bacterium]|nr:F0F1 ATP synthase subunit B [Armatimonadota bacterium]
MQLLHDLGIEPGALLINILGFLVLLWFFKRFLWGPIAQFLGERSREIESRITEAKQLNDEAKQRHESLQAELHDEREAARSEITHLTQDARAAIAEMHAEGRRERQELIEQGQREIERAKEIALAELRRSVGDLAIEISSKIIREALNDQRQEALIDEFLRDIERAAREQRPE